jgi:aminopeptidase YwaD
MTKKLFAALLMALFLVGAVAAPALAQSQQALLAFDRKVIQRINIENMWQHLQVLTEDVGPRCMGTSEDRAGVDYIASVLAGYGYEVSLFEFPLPSSRMVPEVAVVAPVEMKLFPAPLTNTGLTTGDGITAQVIDWADSATPPSDWIPGSIALMNGPASVTNYNSYRAAAIAANAAGVILIKGDTGRLTGSVSSPRTIPMLLISPVQGEKLRALFATPPVTVNIQVTLGGFSQHVIGTRKPSNENKSTDNVIIVGGHHDSVYGSRGANDNASSVVTLLEMARVFADYPIDRELRFMAFGAEEGGGGAAQYVASLSAEERARITMINMEMLGSAYAPQERTFVATARNPSIPNFMTDSVMDAGDRLLFPVPFAGRVTGSDHVAFRNGGMEEAIYARAYPGNIPWDPLNRYGLEPQYHTPLDTMEFMSPERLEAAAKVVAAGIYDFLRKDTMNLVRSAIRRDLDFSAESAAFPPANSLGEEVSE